MIESYPLKTNISDPELTDPKPTQPLGLPNPQTTLFKPHNDLLYAVVLKR